MSDVVDAQIWCGSESIEGKRWDCVLPDGHAGPHTALIQWIDPEPEHAPLPEWRRLVDQAKPHGYPTPQGEVLAALCEAESNGGTFIEGCLARIVTVCEQQVGDGWQAEPRRYDEATPFSAWGLLRAFRSGGGKDRPTRSDWEALAEHAAAWLRHLTEESS